VKNTNIWKTFLNELNHNNKKYNEQKREFDIADDGEYDIFSS